MGEWTVACCCCWVRSQRRGWGHFAGSCCLWQVPSSSPHYTSRHAPGDRRAPTSEEGAPMRSDAFWANPAFLLTKSQEGGLSGPLTPHLQEWHSPAPLASSRLRTGSGAAAESTAREGRQGCSASQQAESQSSPPAPCALGLGKDPDHPSPEIRSGRVTGGEQSAAPGRALSGPPHSQRWGGGRPGTEGGALTRGLLGPKMQLQVQVLDHVAQLVVVGVLAELRAGGEQGPGRGAGESGRTGRARSSAAGASPRTAPLEAARGPCFGAGVRRFGAARPRCPPAARGGAPGLGQPRRSPGPRWCLRSSPLAPSAAA